jgi:hypothetical protein
MPLWALFQQQSLLAPAMCAAIIRSTSLPPLALLPMASSRLSQLSMSTRHWKLSLRPCPCDRHGSDDGFVGNVTPAMPLRYGDVWLSLPEPAMSIQ